MKLIIDTDPGVDDALAIALAVQLPKTELLGLTTIFGNTYVEQSTRNARYLLDMLGSPSPVAQGADLPFGEVDYAPSANVHGPEGFGDIADIPPAGASVNETAAEFLVSQAREHAGELVICAIGPLTNIALALRLDPSFASNVRRLVIMGGAFACAGNITPHAEANIFHDAKAADEVFASDLRIEMVGLDATMQTLLTAEHFADLARHSRQLGGFIEQISLFYLGFYRSVGITDGCPMHDSTAVLACYQPERFEWVQSGLRVVQEGDAIGATVADHSRQPIRIATGVDATWAVSTALELVGRSD